MAGPVLWFVDHLHACHDRKIHVNFVHYVMPATTAKAMACSVPLTHFRHGKFCWHHCQCSLLHANEATSYLHTWLPTLLISHSEIPAVPKVKSRVGQWNFIDLAIRASFHNKNCHMNVESMLFATTLTIVTKKIYYEGKRSFIEYQLYKVRADCQRIRRSEEYITFH